MGDEIFRPYWHDVSLVHKLCMHKFGGYGQFGRSTDLKDMRLNGLRCYGLSAARRHS